MPKPIPAPKRSPLDEGRAIVADLSRELTWGVTFSRYVATLPAESRAWLRELVQAARSQREVIVARQDAEDDSALTISPEVRFLRPAEEAEPEPSRSLPQCA